ncbi:MAG TPA: hypothetical protein VHH12_13440 [Mycobacterium sp.]|nr:hypothetical protein [Mycobacterium sp.]
MSLNTEHAPFGTGMGARSDDRAERRDERVARSGAVSSPPVNGG